MAATLILFAASLYLLFGACVALIFVTWGLDRVEPNARGAIAFRPLLVPGAVLIWPLVIWRWRAAAAGEDPASRHRPPRRAQDAAALAMAVAIPVILAVGLLVRQDGPHEAEAVLLAPPEARP